MALEAQERNQRQLEQVERARRKAETQQGIKNLQKRRKEELRVAQVAKEQEREQVNMASSSTGFLGTRPAHAAPSTTTKLTSFVKGLARSRGDTGVGSRQQ